MIPREIKAKRGDWILPKWIALLNFIKRTNKIIRGDGVRIQYLPSGGVYIYADDNFNPWAHPFKVRLSSSEMTISEGTINGVIPAIEDVRLDGSKADSEELEQPPKLQIKNPESRRSYIALKLTFSEDPVEFSADDPKAAQIVHVPEIPKLFVQGGAVVNDDNTTLYPLASIYWTEGGNIRRVFQITHHNLNHRFVRGGALSGKPSRHLFWAA